MFHWLGESVARHWKLCMVLWFSLAIAANGVLAGWWNQTHLFGVHIPQWNDIVEDGQFAFLPGNMPSVQAENVFKKAFPKDKLTSSVVVVLERADRPLTDQDRAFITDELTPRLEDLRQEKGSIILKVRDFNDNQIGKLLDSADGKASLVVAELEYEFLDQRNRRTVDRIEKLVDPQNGELKGKIPAGLGVAMSGAATVGRDMLAAEAASAADTQSWTVVLVVTLLLVIYRAPFVALIPLVTVFVAMHIAIACLTLMAWAGKLGYFPFTYVQPFTGLQTYISVVVYGAGVDYSLFLLARYKEEFDRDRHIDRALSRSLERVGASLVASALTVACGIGMMVFALFGKFQQAGIAMSFSLIVMLICALTLTPSMLRLTGKYVFWPHFSSAETRTGNAPAQPSYWEKLLSAGDGNWIWEWVAGAITKRPGVIWGVSVLIMLPFAAIGAIYHNDLSFGLLSELPPNTTSVVGARAVQRHFAAGETGPITVLLYNPKLDFTDSDNFDAVETLVQNLKDKQKELGLADIRSAINPLGLNVQTGIVGRGVARKRYLSEADGMADHVVRLDLVLTDDPFAKDSMHQIESLEAGFPALLPAPIRSGTQLYFQGTTTSILDLKTVTDRDQMVIDGSVLLVVLMILIVLLRMVSISTYLVASVFFGYFVSLGMTMCIFRLIDPAFAGIDWKVPIFLFTILVAVGEDYNIFLMSRIQEDQHANGPVKGIRSAMLATGSIISSCGLIMAGTFFSLVLAGQLRGSQQLGTALTIGVLLDTFIVRPVLVPAWLILLNTNRFGEHISRWLGAERGASATLSH